MAEHQYHVVHVRTAGDLDRLKKLVEGQEVKHVFIQKTKIAEDCEMDWAGEHWRLLNALRFRPLKLAALWLARQYCRLKARGVAVVVSFERAGWGVTAVFHKPWRVTVRYGSAFIDEGSVERLYRRVERLEKWGDWEVDIHLEMDVECYNPRNAGYTCTPSESAV